MDSYQRFSHGMLCFDCWRECEHITIACTKPTVSHFLFSGMEFIKKQEAMHIQSDADKYIYTVYIESAQVAAFDPTAKHDC